jgi:hypothetical protein
MKQLSKIFFAFVVFCACQAFTLSSRGQQGPSFIPLDSANKMISSYLGSLSSLPPDNVVSFSFNASDLKDYLQSDSTITNVKISLAHTLDYINSGGQYIPAGYQSGALTLIIAAYDQNGNYRFFNSTVMDHGRPCPSNCPTGNAASPLY